MPRIDPLPTPPAPVRLATAVLEPSLNTPSFKIDSKNKSYKHQYSNIYFIRLRLLRESVEKRAAKRWSNVAGNPVLVPSVLEVVKSRLCYIIGTVYMDMPLKPNVMEDIARDQSIPPPPPNPKFHSPEDTVMLEDESGRIHLVGDRVKNARLVTGVIVGALGAETPNGEFEVVDLCYPGMAPQEVETETNIRDENGMDVDGQGESADEWIAVVSGLDIGSASAPDAQIQMLVEYLTGEEGGIAEQVSVSRISRLIIAGNSLSPLGPTGKGETGESDQPHQRKARRYGYDAATFSPHPIIGLSDALLDIAQALPVHILPGESDPSGTIMPQQCFPKAMFGAVSKLSTFFCETNPTYIRLGPLPQPEVDTVDRAPFDRTILVNSGQPLNDMFKYLPSPPNTRLTILESTLKWRHIAPTAPDTLWCHPYFGDDPFIITETPNIYIAGNQNRFATKMVVDEAVNGEGSNARCRVIMVPEFAKTGILVLVNLRSLNVKTVSFEVQGMTGAGEDAPESQATEPPHSSPLLAPESSAPESSPQYL